MRCQPVQLMLAESTWIQQCIIYILLACRSVMLCIVLEPEETTCTTRMLWSYVYGEITDIGAVIK